MKRFAVCFLVTTAILGAPARADEIAFRPAYHLTAADAPPAGVQREAAIRFDDFLDTDWEGLAREHFTAYPLTGLSSAQVAELAASTDYYNVAVSYRAPVSEAYRLARLVFLSADGMRLLRVTGLEGTVLFGLSTDRKAVERVTHFGRILGMPEPNNAPGGGFVAMLGPGQELVGERLVDSENSALDAVNPLEGLPVETQVEYRFSGDDHAYLFVKYGADIGCDYGCCQFIYVLFRKDPGTGALTQLLSSMYACDV